MAHRPMTSVTLRRQAIPLMPPTITVLTMKTGLHPPPRQAPRLLRTPSSSSSSHLTADDERRGVPLRPYLPPLTLHSSSSTWPSLYAWVKPGPHRATSPGPTLPPPQNRHTLVSQPQHRLSSPPREERGPRFERIWQSSSPIMLPPIIRSRPNSDTGSPSLSQK